MTTAYRMLLIVAAMLAWFVPDAEARGYDPTTGRWLQRDPIRYVDGMNRYQYVVSNPLRWVDPLGLQAQDEGGEQKCKPIDCTNPAGLNDCEKTYCWLSGSFPALPDGRLDDARNKSGIDALATMFTLAWKESSFNPNAKNPRSTARGLYQILDGTKKDIEDRV